MIRIILLFIVLFLIYKILNNNEEENFIRSSGKWCDNCEKKSFGQCLDCYNCGFCVSDYGKGYCTKGNVYGPESNKENCSRWIHSDEFSTLLNLKKNNCKN